MINLSFFPSKRIAWYMAKTFLLRSVAVLIALVIVLQTLDLLGESGKILAVDGNTDADLWRYVAMRFPQLVARFLPFAVLLGTLITLVTMNQNSEIVSMKAAGISAHQIIAPLIAASIFLAGFAFVFQETVVTRATATLNAWQAAEYAPIALDDGVETNVWIRDGDDLVLARRVTGENADVRLEGIEIYERTGGTLETMISAKSARPDGTAWRLEDVRRFAIGARTPERLPTLRMLDGVDPNQFTLVGVRADEQDLVTLKGAIGDLKEGGVPTTALESGWWHKLSAPLSAVLMPLLAAVAAFGLARSGQLFVRAVIGMGLGFAYFVVDNFALAMGNLGAYPPMLAAWAPFALFLLVGEAVLIRTEE